MKTKPKTKSKGTTPLPAPDGIRDKSEILELSKDLAAFAKGVGNPDDLACKCFDLLRRKFGCYVSAYTPGDIISNFEEQFPEMTREQAKEILDTAGDCGWIYKAEWDVINENTRNIMPSKQKGGNK